MPCCKRGKKIKNAVEAVLEPFRPPQEKLVEVLDRIDAAMSRGLQSVLDYDIRMFPTFIHSVPNSKEKGKFLSMDLGITKLVISLVELRGKHISFKREEGQASTVAPEEEVTKF